MTSLTTSHHVLHMCVFHMSCTFLAVKVWSLLCAGNRVTLEMLDIWEQGFLQQNSHRMVNKLMLKVLLYVTHSKSYYGFLRLKLMCTEISKRGWPFYLHTSCICVRILTIQESKNNCARGESLELMMC